MNLRSTGKKVLLFTLLLMIVLNFIPVHYTVRLFFGSFGFGSGLVLLAISSSKKYDL